MSCSKSDYEESSGNSSVSTQEGPSDFFMGEVIETISVQTDLSFPCHQVACEVLADPNEMVSVGFSSLASERLQLHNQCQQRVMAILGSVPCLAVEALVNSADCCLEPFDVDDMKIAVNHANESLRKFCEFVSEVLVTPELSGVSDIKLILDEAGVEADYWRIASALGGRGQTLWPIGAITSSEDAYAALGVLADLGYMNLDGSKCDAAYEAAIRRLAGRFDSEEASRPRGRRHKRR